MNENFNEDINTSKDEMISRAEMPVIEPNIDDVPVHEKNISNEEFVEPPLSFEELSLKIEMGHEEISSEEFAAAQEIAIDVEKINILATREDASTTIRANALANAFLVASSEEKQQIMEAQAIVAEKGDVASFAEWVGKKGKGVIASLALVVGLGAFAQNANAGGLDSLFQALNSPAIQGSINKINEGMNASARLSEINRTEQSLRDQINSLEQQKQLALRQGETNQRIQSVENSVDSRVNPGELNANYKAQRAQFELRKEDSKKHFLEIQNPTSADLTRYESEQARLNADAQRLEGDYQKNAAREQGRSSVQSAQIGVNSAYANARIHDIEMQQARMKDQISNLNIQRLQVMQGASQSFGR